MNDDLEVLLSDGFHRSVEANLRRDPMRIALDGRLPHAALVASQVKYLERAEHKLPSYHAARCILPPLAYEQSSSEAAAARKEYSGRLAIDLTCGLGVDALYLSKRFERVVALERDEALAAIARENFRRLGAHNIEVVRSTAEEFLIDTHIRADLVYADPDRRGGNDPSNIRAGGKKMVKIKDCSPDIISLLPQIRAISPHLIVKLSPMFDVDEVFRVFDPAPSIEVEVISLGGECKEIIADVLLSPRVCRREPADDRSAPVDDVASFGATVRAVAIGVGEYVSTHGDPPPHDGIFEPEKYHFLVVPDVALQKARLARRYLTERGVWIDSDNGYGFAVDEPERVMGRILGIENLEPFDPKGLKRRLRAQGIRNLDILKREFPLPAADIARQLGVREGGATRIAFTRAGGRLWQITLKA